MNTPDLGRLELVDLRQSWSHEALSFTPWLAEESNLKLLGQTIGIDLELESVERDVGPFRADILCHDLQDEEHLILVENQLEKTDHTHLGQILTYAAGLNAQTIVWIAARFTDEHRAALDWLNNNTSTHFKFFGVQIELWKIDDSKPAPRFNIVSKPNDWTKRVQQSASPPSSEALKRRERRIIFWNRFSTYLEEQRSQFSLARENAAGHAAFPSGFDNIAYVVWVNFPKDKPGGGGAFLRLSGENNVNVYQYLIPHFQDIFANLGFTLSWSEPTPGYSHHLACSTNIDSSNETNWPQLFEWFHDRLQKLQETFEPHLRLYHAEFPQGED